MRICIFMSMVIKQMFVNLYYTEVILFSNIQKARFFFLYHDHCYSHFDANSAITLLIHMIQKLCPFHTLKKTVTNIVIPPGTKNIN